MKTNELMIGNWVIAPDENLKLREVRVEIIKNRLIMDNNFNLSSVDSSTPIPITEDFLKENGFIHKCLIEPDKHYPEGLFEWEKEVQDNCLTLSVSSNKIGCDWRLYIENCDRCGFDCIHIQYVHQLQNVLNILGIEMEVTP